MAPPRTSDAPQPGPTDLRELADAMRALAGRATSGAGYESLDELVNLAVERVAGARWASVTVLTGGRFTTRASSDETATKADLLQYEIGSGPCVDAVLDDAVYLTGEVATDGRWPTWGRRVHEELGVDSVLSQRLTLLEESGAIAGLNIYSDAPHAFDEQAVGTGLVLSTHASLLVSATLARSRATNLLEALESNREIGVAMGILMQQHQLTREQAFDVLRVASQDSNRKLALVATEVADTGTLTIRRWPSSAPGRSPVA